MSRIYYSMLITYRQIVLFSSIFIASFIAFNCDVQASSPDPQADFYRAKGLGEQQKGNLEGALKFYIKAAGIGPESPDIYNDIGILYEQMGSPEKAEQYYLRILKIDKDYLPVYSNLAYLYLGLGEKETAKKYFLERLKRGPRNDPWKKKISDELFRLDPSLKEGMVQEEMAKTSRELAEQATRKAQEDFKIAIVRAEKHYKRGEDFRAARKYKEAFEEFDNALKITPDNPKLVRAKERAEYEERIEEVKQSIGAATGFLDTGDVDSAKKEFQHILAIFPKQTLQN